LIALGEKNVAVRIEALGARRGPAPEARALYTIVENAG
jgi:ribosomal 50S subunit-recycling heat shock protein